jgi:hypothetical protein
MAVPEFSILRAMQGGYSLVRLPDLAVERDLYVIEFTETSGTVPNETNTDIVSANYDVTARCAFGDFRFNPSIDRLELIEGTGSWTSLSASLDVSASSGASFFAYFYYDVDTDDWANNIYTVLSPVPTMVISISTSGSSQTFESDGPGNSAASYGIANKEYGNSFPSPPWGIVGPSLTGATESETLEYRFQVLWRPGQ